MSGFADASAVGQTAEAAEVTIEHEYMLLAGVGSGRAAGGFTATGAIVDRGRSSSEYRFSAAALENEPRAVTAMEVLEGVCGTLALHLVGVFGPLVDGRLEGSGHWVVTGGTGAYEGVSGTGTWAASGDFRRVLEGEGSPVARATYVGGLRWDQPKEAT